MPPRAAPSSFPRSITVAGRTLSLDTVKHILIAWCVVRVLSSGFFGRAVTAVAAGCLAYGARALPGLVPGEWKCGKAGVGPACQTWSGADWVGGLVARTRPPSSAGGHTHTHHTRVCGVGAGGKAE